MGYHPVTGALATATDRFNNGFTFGYDPAGQRTSLSGPGFSDVTEYDLEGRRTRRLETAAGLTLHDERFQYDARGKVLQVTNSASAYYQWYSGLGMLAGTDWQNVHNAGFQAEEFATDALGNVYWSRSGDLANRSWLPSYTTMYRPGIGGVLRVSKQEPENPQNNVFYPETTRRLYDASGNAAMGEHEVYGQLNASTYGVVRHSRSKSFYSADQRLRYYQDNVLNGGTSVTTAGVWEEYRYDPLGRRVLVRSNRDDLCSGGGSGACVSHVTRYVWSGDQVLWELRLNSEDAFNLEGVSSTGDYHGRVSYFHAGGIDRPLVIRKEGHPTIVPHENWRGQFARGTYTSGAVSDCTGQTTACTNINWPGYRTNAWHAPGSDGPDIRTWFGGLVDGMRDASGQMYMRNRYYDPATGQFTQTDPIGLGGGLNAYGFAAGDPVSYSDPYGLCWQLWRAECRQSVSDGVRDLFGGSPRVRVEIGEPTVTLDESGLPPRPVSVRTVRQATAMMNAAERASQSGNEFLNQPLDASQDVDALYTLREQWGRDHTAAVQEGGKTGASVLADLITFTTGWIGKITKIPNDTSGN